jgi:hypothetical protein
MSPDLDTFDKAKASFWFFCVIYDRSKELRVKVWHYFNDET